MTQPTTLFVVTINHEHASTEVRERAHLDDERAGKLIQELTALPSCVSVIPVSTCNRTEIYVEALPDHDCGPMLSQALTAVGIDADLFFGEHARLLEGPAATKHLYRVTAGLQSMMLGEPQITFQLKNAYRRARQHQELGSGLLRAFQGAFRAGKRVRSETKISQGAVSVAFAAVELARKIFDSLCDQRAVLVGAGETGALAARHFLQHNIGHLTVINRGGERATELAETFAAERAAAATSPRAADKDRIPNARAECGRVDAQRWESLAEALVDADVVLATTGATDPVILPDMVKSAVKKRRGKPLFLLDIAVPRDIHPDVAKVPGVYLFGLDDLDEIIQTNLIARRRELPQAERIIVEELEELQQWLNDIDLRPTVAEFKAYLESVKDKQMGFVRKKQSAEVAAAVDSSLQQFIKKVLGRSMTTLKAAESQEQREHDLTSLRRLFGPDLKDRN